MRAAELLRFYNAPRGARLARSSSLWRDFVAVTGRRPPTKGFKASWAFSGCLLRARVVTVHQRVEGRERVSMADCERYSKIDALLGLLQGAPPVCCAEVAAPAHEKHPRTCWS